MFRQVMLASVANNEYDYRVFVERVRDPQRCCEVRARRTAAEDAFDSSQLPGHLKRFAIRDVDHFINVLDMYVWRNDLLSDSFHQIRRRFDEVPGFFERFEDRTIRIRADDLDVWVLLFQKPASARDCAACSDAGHEVCDLALSLTPDLRTGGSIVRFRICGM